MPKPACIDPASAVADYIHLSWVTFNPLKVASLLQQITVSVRVSFSSQAFDYRNSNINQSAPQTTAAKRICGVYLIMCSCETTLL